MNKSDANLREQTVAKLECLPGERIGDPQFLYFPLKKLGKDKSIFLDRDMGIFSEEFNGEMQSIINKQLAVHTYYENELIATAGTHISVDLLKKFDALKINFKVMKNETSTTENHELFEHEMAQLIKRQNRFFDRLENGDISGIQNRVNGYIHCALSKGNLHWSIHIQKKYQHLLPYLKGACASLTSKKKYIALTFALNQIIENDNCFSNTKNMGETITHIVRMSWISLIMAHEIEEFGEDEYQILGLICLGHDTGKAMIPQKILYKRGRLTSLENEIMKSHAFFSFLLASHNQHFLDFESFVMGLHHVKEDNSLPQSYGIFHDTPASFSKYLTTDSRTKLDQLYETTIKFYRVINIADTFEAITASRIYKKPSSVGKALEIMVKNNTRNRVLHPPYLNTLIKLIINTILPEGIIFRLTDKILDVCLADKTTPEQRSFLKQNHQGVIVRSCDQLEQNLECLIFKTRQKEASRPVQLPPMLFLENIFL